MKEKSDKNIIIISIMLTIFVGLLIFILAIEMTLKAKEPPITRMITAKVINTENDNTLLEDTTGNVWSIEDNSYSKGIEVIVTFDTKGTVSILDDEIIKISVDK